ncbi:MAG TPA: ATP-binding cassette domain-containing protein, partial [Chthonomonadales bacterium]|nr:ATP-binding cassette domain-containing protein [Chthonomonadales bacterium]
MTASPQDVAVEMRAVRKRYGGLTALAGVDFLAVRGEIHALLGENGAGKTTLMRVLAGLTLPDAGEILIDGQPARICSPAGARRMGVAMVHQHFALVSAFTVAENLALASPRTGRRFSARRSAAHAMEIASGLGWQLPPEAVTGSLPVGHRQRVEIASALATGARIVIFDEPTAVLTEPEIKELFGVMRQLRAAGRTVILIAHKLAEIMEVADRVTVLRRGENAGAAEVKSTSVEQLALWMMGCAGAVAPLSPSASAAPSHKALELQSVSARGDRGHMAL